MKKTLGRVYMKLFTKLALASSVAISGHSFALQAMDDAALSATTGQDGISIGIGATNINIDKVHVFDGDGLATDATLPGGDSPIVGGTAQAGAIEIADIKLSVNTDSALKSGNFVDLTIDTDAGTNADNSATAPFLNIGAAVSGLNVELGKISVKSATKDVDTGFMTAVDENSAVILNGLTVKTGTVAANIQLGNTPQGAMIKLDGTMQGGLELNNISLKDASNAGGGEILLGKIRINDTGSADMALNTDIAVTKDGLQLTALKSKTDIYVQGVQLGQASNASIGDIKISGLSIMNGQSPGAKITISGH